MTYDWATPEICIASVSLLMLPTKKCHHTLRLKAFYSLYFISNVLSPTELLPISDRTLIIDKYFLEMAKDQSPLLSSLLVQRGSS